MPPGAKSAVLNYLAWSDGSSIDCFAITAAGVEIWCNRIACGQFSTTTLGAGARHSGEQIQVVANQLDGFTHIKLAVVRGTARIKSISFLPADHPTATCSLDPATDNLSDSRIKTEVQEVSGAQSLDILSNIKTMTYTRTDSGENRLGHVADEVETASAGLGVSNATGPPTMRREIYPTECYRLLTMRDLSLCS